MWMWSDCCHTASALGERVDEEGMVYDVDGGEATVYFCDRFRRYRFPGGRGALALLRGLVAVNKRLLGRNAGLFEGKGEVEVER